MLDLLTRVFASFSLEAILKLFTIYTWQLPAIGDHWFPNWWQMANDSMGVLRLFFRAVVFLRVKLGWSPVASYDMFHWCNLSDWLHLKEHAMSAWNCGSMIAISNTLILMQELLEGQARYNNLAVSFALLLSSNNFTSIKSMEEKIICHKLSKC